MTILTEENCRQALLGGLLLGGGGGGRLADGLRAMDDALTYADELEMVDVDELGPGDVVVTVSTAGTASEFEEGLTIDHWMTALNNFAEACGRKLAGFISCENGGSSTANGWILSALTGLPMVDAPCSGRACPTEVMESMGLELLPDYETLQTACGGMGPRYVETVVKGALATTTQVVRASAAAGSGMVAVIRHPVNAAYLKDHAAPGAVAQAIEIGRLYEACQRQARETGTEAGSLYVRALEDRYDARVLMRGVISDCSPRTEGGDGVGHLDVKSAEDAITLTFRDEFMFVNRGQERLATFPDLICLLDEKTGRPVTTAEVRDGRAVCALVIPKERLILGAGMTSGSEDLFD